LDYVGSCSCCGGGGGGATVVAVVVVQALVTIETMNKSSTTKVTYFVVFTVLSYHGTVWSSPY
jgi:hypothetical protein